MAPPGDNAVYVVDHGWHVEIGLATDRLDGPLGVFRTIFPGARALMFGFGKKTFITAPPDDVAEYFLGPIPGPAVIQVTGLSVLPTDAYGGEDTVTLPISAEQSRRLSAWLWGQFAHDDGAALRQVGDGPFPGALFYAASAGYSLFHTCNTWAALALASAGLPVPPRGVVLAHQTMDRSAFAARALCRPD